MAKKIVGFIKLQVPAGKANPSPPIGPALGQRKSPPATALLKKAAKIEKGSGKAHLDKVGKVTRAQLEEIAKIKMKDLNAADLDGAVKIIAGSARSIGIVVEGV